MQSIARVTRATRRFHRKGHGWFESERILCGIIFEIINNPNRDVNLKRYYVSGEGHAEPFSLQPIIYYVLIIISLVNLLLNAIK